MSQKQHMKMAFEMLEDAGAVEIRSHSDHHKYRMPDGSMLVLPSTPSCPRSVNNAVAMVRRRLRATHPEIAVRGWNNPKPRPIEMFSQAPSHQSPVIFVPKQVAVITPEPVQPLKVEQPVVVMDTMLQRAKMTLQDVNKRLEGYQDRMEELKELERQHEADELNKLQLEEFIEEHGKLMKLAEPLALLLPEYTASEVQAVTAAVTEVSKYQPAVVCTFSPKDLFKAVFPMIKGVSEFSAPMLYEAMQKTNLPKPHPHTGQLSSWLFAATRSAKPVIEPVKRGYYRFKSGASEILQLNS